MAREELNISLNLNDPASLDFCPGFSVLFDLFLFRAVKWFYLLMYWLPPKV